MAKPEWGTKRTCPQTGERFYDLGKDNPVTSPNGHQWYPEPVLKSKQPVAVPEKTEKPAPEEAEDSTEDENDIDLDDDNDIDLGDDNEDDVLADVSLDDDDADLSEVVQAPGDDEDDS
ncbi:MAG: TIGR02300 family protein [Pseudomonadota bacterium]